MAQAVQGNSQKIAQPDQSRLQKWWSPQNWWSRKIDRAGSADSSIPVPTTPWMIDHIEEDQSQRWAEKEVQIVVGTPLVTDWDSHSFEPWQNGRSEDSFHPEQYEPAVLPTDVQKSIVIESVASSNSLITNEEIPVTDEIIKAPLVAEPSFFGNLAKDLKVAFKMIGFILFALTGIGFVYLISRKKDDSNKIIVSPASPIAIRPASPASSTDVEDHGRPISPTPSTESRDRPNSPVVSDECEDPDDYVRPPRFIDENYFK